MDAALIAAAQAVEHYEMTRYGTLIAWARQLGRSDCAALLKQNLAEEKATDKKLTEHGRKPHQPAGGRVAMAKLSRRRRYAPALSRAGTAWPVCA